VATIASKLIEGTKAADEVKNILGTTSLVDAAVWADCAKGVKVPELKYEGAGQYPDCAVFETPDGEKAMVDFVKRNNNNCEIKPGEEICHKQYHYADIAPQHSDYKPTYHGARPDDIVASIRAAVAVLRGQPAPKPYDILDKHEALLLLVHYVGDIHQPLHVGAIYLDAKGKIVNPDKGTFDPATETKGGNAISVVSGGSGNLHTTTWDAIPSDLKPELVDAAWISRAKKVRPTKGDAATWSATWASETQKAAQGAFKNLKFGPKVGNDWSVKLPGTYPAMMETVKAKQLTSAGARLAQLLEALWPDQPVAIAGGGKHKK
jgi:hypothetical protein